MNVKKLVDELEKVVEYRKIDLPFEVWEAIRTIEHREVFGDDAEALNILGNFEAGEREIDELIEEIYEFGKTEAEVWEFAYSLELGKKEEGPFLEVEGVEGSVYPYWDGETLWIEGVDVGLQVELVSFVDGVDPAIVVDEILKYMEGE